MGVRRGPPKRSCKHVQYEGLLEFWQVRNLCWSIFLYINSRFSINSRSNFCIEPFFWIVPWTVQFRPFGDNRCFVKRKTLCFGLPYVMWGWSLYGTDVGNDIPILGRVTLPYVLDCRLLRVESSPIQYIFIVCSVGFFVQHNGTFLYDWNTCWMPILKFSERNKWLVVDNRRRGLVSLSCDSGCWCRINATVFGYN